MKLFPLALILCIPVIGLAQVLNSPCAAPLTKGVYDYYNFSQQDDFYLAFRSYTNTKTFEDDVKKGSWAIGGKGLIEGIPVGGSLGSSSSSSHEFVQSVRSMQELNFRRFTDTIVSRVSVNNEAYREFVKCVNSQKVRISPKRSSNQTDAVFDVECWSNNPKVGFPTINNIYAVGADGDIEITPSVKFGDEYPGPFSVKVKRIDRFQTVTLFVVTSEGTTPEELTGDPLDYIAQNENFTELYEKLQRMGKEGYKARSLEYLGALKLWRVTLDRIPEKQFEYVEKQQQVPPSAWYQQQVEAKYEVFVVKFLYDGSYWRKALGVREKQPEENKSAEKKKS